MTVFPYFTCGTILLNSPPCIKKNNQNFDDMIVDYIDIEKDELKLMLKWQFNFDPQATILSFLSDCNISLK